jgi:hypothetical protein
MTQRKEHSWNKWDYESWCWRQLHAADTCSSTRHVPFLCVKTQTSAHKEQYQCTLSTWVKSDVMSSTREDVIRRRHVLLGCADSSLNHEWSKTASFVSCLDAYLDAVGVRLPLDRAATVISANLHYQYNIHPHTTKWQLTSGLVCIRSLHCNYLQLATAHFHALTQPFAPGKE